MNFMARLCRPSSQGKHTTALSVQQVRHGQQHTQDQTLDMWIEWLLAINTCLHMSVHLMLQCMCRSALQHSCMASPRLQAYDTAQQGLQVLGKRGQLLGLLSLPHTAIDTAA
jgi:hypothetical protein